MQDDAELLVFMTPFSSTPLSCLVQSPPEATKVADDLNFHMDDMLHVGRCSSKHFCYWSFNFLSVFLKSKTVLVQVRYVIQNIRYGYIFTSQKLQHFLHKLVFVLSYKYFNIQDV